MKKTIVRLISLLAALALAMGLAACGGAGKGSGATGSTSSTAPQISQDIQSNGSMSDRFDMAAEESGSIGSAPGAPADRTSTSLLPQDGRKVILNASLTIEALDFDATCAALMAALRDAGGYVAGTDQYTPSYEGAQRRAHYQLRVPADRYDTFLEGAGKAGNLTNKTESTQDVTSEYVDVEARLKSLKMQEERLYAMMEQAGELETLLAIQNQLTEVQYQIESYTSRQRTFDDLIAYSTVDVDVEEVRQITVKAETFAERIGKAFRQSWGRFGDNVQDFAVGFVDAIPSLLVLAVLITLLVLLVRMLSRRAAAHRAAHPVQPYKPAEYTMPPKPAPAADTEESKTEREPKYK